MRRLVDTDIIVIEVYYMIVTHNDDRDTLEDKSTNTD